MAMAMDGSTLSWAETTKYEIMRDVNSTSTWVVPGGDNTQVVVYVLLGLGALAPVVLLLSVAVVLRHRRTARLATYNSAPVVDAVDAWNLPPLYGNTTGAKTAAVRPVDGAPATLSELAVREFFDVHDHQACQLYVSVEPNDRPRAGASEAASPATLASSTPGSSVWTSGSESSGEMERRAEDLVALIGRPSTDAEKTRDCICDEGPFTASTTVSNAVPDTSENGPCPSTGSAGSTVHTVVVEVERPPSGDLETNLNEDDQRPEPISCLSKMRRSEACYDIAQISSSSPVSVHDSLCRRTSSNSSAAPTSGVVATEPQPSEDLCSEEEKALKCLDAIAYEYADHDAQELRLDIP